MKTYALLAGSLLALTGCSGVSTSYEVYVSPELVDRVPNVMAAMDEWLFLTEGNLHLTVKMAHIKSIEDNHEIVIGPTTTDQINGKLGLTIFPNKLYDTAIVLLPMDIVDMNVVNQTIRHEFGHALGLSHTGPDTVMCQRYECSAHHITCADVQQYYELRGIHQECRYDRPPQTF